MRLYSLDEIATLAGWEPDAARRLALHAGLCLPRWVERGIAPTKPLSWHLARLRRALAQGQVQVLFDRYGRHAGSFLWTGLDDAGEAAILGGGIEAIEAGMQGADGQAWMLDLDTRFGNARAVLDAVRAVFSRDHGELAYVRSKGRRRIAKRVCLNGRAGASTGAAASFNALTPGTQLFHEMLATLDEALHLGECCLLLDGAPEHRDRTPRDIGAALCFPLSLGQAVTVRTPSGQMAGFLTFAWLTGDGQRRLDELGPAALSPSCLNEGTTLVGLCGWACGEDGELALAAALGGLHPGRARVFDAARLPAHLKALPCGRQAGAAS
jgi:hemolysin-activating ACP:hemolysin acyltransferase